MNWVHAARLLVLAAPAVLFVPLPAPAASSLTVYDDQLRNGFADWSWATHSLSQTAVVHGGAAAISFVPAGWGALYLHSDAGLSTGTYDALEFWVNGAGAGNQSIQVAVVTGTSQTGSTPLLSGFVTGGSIPAGQWAKVRVPFASLGLDTASTVNGFWLQDATGGSQPTVYVDDVVVTAWATPPPPPPAGQAVTVSVDTSLDRLPISPLIFGVSFGSAAQAARMRWPLRRWGGNSTTRYSWQDDVSNHASDWFFYNFEEANSNLGALPDGSSADVFVDATRAGGGDSMITVPLIGWTPKDRVRRWGFSVAKYGAQQQTECTYTGGASWCQPDAGNGVKPDGTTFVTGNDPHDTSREIGPSFVTDWMAHLAGRTGTAAQGGVRFWALDNEPMLWNSTHRDVHPLPTTYDELWAKTLGVAVAMKAQDPGAKLFGPTLWGWCAYFYSAADGCGPGADQAAHGGVPFLPWYLAQAAQYEAAHGVRLVDYADVHYYPQAAGVNLSDDESTATSALRLRSLKSLYDPAYVDESWIGQPVRLIPRLREWIAANYPGTKIAVNEYNFGKDTGISSTLAQAEALAIFGREGVDAAARWTAPDDGSRMEDAFLLHMNYDGAGAAAIGESVRAVSSNVDAVGAYAVANPTGSLLLLLFNKDTVVRPVTASIAGVAAAPVRLFSFDVSDRLHAAGTAAVTGGSLALDLPARSATLAEIAFAAATGGSTFHPVTPCRLVDTRSPGGYPISGSRMAAAESRSFAVPSSSCAIPSAATAYSLNATVVPTGPLGYLTMWPTGQAKPLVSTLNSPDGRVKANAAIVPAGTSGAISVYVTDATDLVLDVNGYFMPAGSGGELAFYPLAPCRISDTRNAPGTNGGPRMAAGETRSISPSNVCGIPSTAQALSLNYTVVPPGPLGYLTTWPTGQTRPLVSTLNAPTGTIVANAAIVPTGSGGQVSIFVTNATDVIVDVNGYFAPPGTGGLSFYAAAPCRVVDTRNAAGAFGGPQLAASSVRSWAVPSSACSIPSTAQAYSLNATVVPGGSLGYLTLWPAGITQPTASTLNAPDGALTSNAAIVPAGTGASSGSISAFVTGTTHLLLDVNGYFAP